MQQQSHIPEGGAASLAADLPASALQAGMAPAGKRPVLANSPGDQGAGAEVVPEGVRASCLYPSPSGGAAITSAAATLRVAGRRRKPWAFLKFANGKKLQISTKTGEDFEIGRCSALGDEDDTLGVDPRTVRILSRVHCSVAVDADGVVRVTDPETKHREGGKQGIWVNGELVKGASRELQGGDVIEMFRADDADTPPYLSFTYEIAFN